MAVKLELYRVFKEVAETGNISAAAKNLYISQSAVSQSIKQLETALQARLFARSPRGVTLTGEGQMLYQYVRNALGLLATGEDKLSQAQQLLLGTLTIGASDTVTGQFLTPYLDEFHHQHPGIRLKIVSGRSAKVVSMLRSGAVDIAFASSPKDSTLETWPCFATHSVFVAGKNYHCDFDKIYTRQEMAEFPLILLERKASSRVFLEQEFLKAGVTLTPEIELSSRQLLVTLAGIGLGVAGVTLEFVRKDLESITSRTLGETYTIDDSLLQYDSGWMLRQDIEDKAVYEDQLSDEIGLVTSAYCLYVNDVRIGATPYEGALEELLDQLQKAASDEDTISCEFAEDVEIRQEYVPTSEIMNLGYIAELLYSTKTAEVTYEVKKGDTWSQIAAKNDMTSAELLALNPGYNINKLQIGEVLTLSASVPYLTMTVVKQERYLDDVSYNIEYTDSADLYQGDYKVTSKGEYGKADVMAKATYVNGEETERTILSSVTLKEPVTEYRLRGTKVRPTWMPTGSFRWPTSGRISSYFGGRKSPGGIGSTNHKGIDIAVPRGTPIYAADGGTVTYSGWMSGYGYLVQIDHGNGYVTRYGHNSSLTVSVGQHVYKGQQVARAGSTGNSTGNHCHFEVRYNGVAKNPLNYLP